MIRCAKRHRPVQPVAQDTAVINLPDKLLVAGKVFTFESFLSSMERQKNNWQNQLSSAFSLVVADAASRPCPLF